MSMFSEVPQRLSVVAGILALIASLAVAGCSDDPILGPDEGEPDDDGGSYSVIKRLAPSDSVETSPANPERF